MKKSPPPGTHVGIAWYTPASYAALVEVADDRQTLPPTYAVWERAAREILFRLRDDGYVPEQYFVDVEELARWCRKKNAPMDDANRAAFVREKMARR